MKIEKDILNSFSITDKDILRFEEKIHEAKLKKQLSDLGLVVEFDVIVNHGMRSMIIV